MGAKTDQPKSAKKYTRTKRKPDTPAQKRARTEVIVAWVILFAIGAVLLKVLGDWVGIRTTGTETGHGQATVKSCTLHLTGFDCPATLTSWKSLDSKEAWEGKTDHHPGEAVVVRSSSRLAGTVEVAGRLAGGSRVVPGDFAVPTAHTEAYTFEQIVPRSEHVMPDWQRILYFVGFLAVWFTIMWWVGRFWFWFRTRDKPATI